MLSTSQRTKFMKETLKIQLNVTTMKTMWFQELVATERIDLLLDYLIHKPIQLIIIKMAEEEQK